MRKKPAALALLLALAVSGCARLAPPAAAPPRLAAPHDGWVARTLKKMTVEEKIGQMIACRFTAEFRNADSPALREIESLVVDQKIGGLILFAPARVYETAELCNAFHKLAKVPLLMAADFEAGAAFRISATTSFPPLMALGAAGLPATQPAVAAGLRYLRTRLAGDVSTASLAWALLALKSFAAGAPDVPRTADRLARLQADDGGFRDNPFETALAVLVLNDEPILVPAPGGGA
jgi:hypothetical protein